MRNHPMHKPMLAVLIAVAGLLPLSGQAADTGHEAHGNHGAKVSNEKTYGKPGDAKKVARTIAVDMNDTMRFNPSALTVVAGETVKFEIRNSGKVMHEFVLGTLKDLKEHSEQMKKSSGTAHGGAHMVHVAPGKTGTTVWQFTRPGEFHFGCLLPGHFEAGMVGTITVTAKP